MEALTELNESKGVFGILERIKRLFEQEAKQVFYASSQERMTNVLNQNGLLYDRFDDHIYGLFKK